MASITLDVSGVFPSGTTVGAYARSDWPTATRPTWGTAPPGTAVTTAVVSGSTLVFTGLAEDTSYAAGAQVSSSWRFMLFRPDTIDPTRTGDQQFAGNVGINGIPAAATLAVYGPQDLSGPAVSVYAHGQGIAIGQDVDWSPTDNNPHDTVDIYASGTGDAIFAFGGGGIMPASFTFTATTTNGSATLAAVSSFTGLMPGTPITGTGIPAGATILSTNSAASTLVMSAPATASGAGVTITVTRPSGTAGGVSIFNGLIPQYLDALGDGRTGGTILNNRDGMKGLFLDGQVSTNTAPLLYLRDHGAAAAIHIENQQSGAGVNVGTGRSVQIEEYGVVSSVLLNARTRLTAGSGQSLLDIRALWASSGTTAQVATAIQVVDAAVKVRFQLDTRGRITLNDGTRDRLFIQPENESNIFYLADPAGAGRWIVDGNGAMDLRNASGQTVALLNGQTTTNGHFSFGRASTAKVGFYGATPVVQAVAITTPTADVTALKTAVDAIRVALTNVGITA
jgi:hypothetical protein